MRCAINLPFILCPLPAITHGLFTRTCRKCILDQFLLLHISLTYHLYYRCPDEDEDAEAGCVSPCRVLALGHHWPRVPPLTGHRGPQTRVRCPHCGCGPSTESCPAHRPAPRRRTSHRQLRTRARGNLPSVGRTTWASSRQRGDSLCCRFYKSRYLVDWIFYWIC